MVTFFDRALEWPEIRVVMQGLGAFPYAWNPNPLDGALINDTWTTLNWSAGDFAVSHDVYLSDSLADVEAGAEAAFHGNQVSTFFIAGFPGYPCLPFRRHRIDGRHPGDDKPTLLKERSRCHSFKRHTSYGEQRAVFGRGNDADGNRYQQTSPGVCSARE